MARMSTSSRAATDDLVDEYLTAPAVAQMRRYAQMARTANPVTRACDALRRGEAAEVDSALLPPEVAHEYHDPERHTSLTVRLQRGRAPEVVG